MKLRIYLRTLFFYIFKNNPIARGLDTIVKFYYNLWFPLAQDVKFRENVSINYVDTKRNFFFQSISGDKLDCK